MIPTPHRTKGGAPLLGASRAGERGPFGLYTSDREDYAAVTDLPEADSELTAQTDLYEHQADS